MLNNQSRKVIRLNICFIFGSMIKDYTNNKFCNTTIVSFETVEQTLSHFIVKHKRTTTFFPLKLFLDHFFELAICLLQYSPILEKKDKTLCVQIAIAHYSPDL